MILRPTCPLAVLLGLSLAACGGSADDTSTTSTDGTAAGTTSTGDTGTTAQPTTGSSTGGPSDTTADPSTTTTEDPSTITAVTTTTEDPGTSTTEPVDTTAADTGSSSGSTTADVEPSLSFFVSSTGSATANLGGLEGADQRCQDLADAVGAGDRTWRAYLSAEAGPDGAPVHAKDRIGEGPWYNAALTLVAADLTELHALEGDHTLFLDENGAMINGQWENSPDPNEHDILTGSNKDGTLVEGKTCADWTSDDPALFAWVGHSDGLGPNMSDEPMYRPWNSVHENGGCHDTAPKGGSGKVYCFAAD